MGRSASAISEMNCRKRDRKRRGKKGELDGLGTDSCGLGKVNGLKGEKKKDAWGWIELIERT